MFDSNKLSVPTIQQWEEAGAALASAFSRYLDLCISLGPNSQKDGIHPEALVTRIDSALETLHTQLEQRVGQSRSILSRTRNQVLSPICRFPSEILSEIFAYVIFDGIDPSNPARMDVSLVDTYKSLHSLLGVCSTWRNVALGRGMFWSIVPILEPNSLSPLCDSQGKSFSTGLSLERSGSTNLHLAAIVPKPGLAVDFAKHVSRFGSINIQSESTLAIAKLLSHFIKSGFPLQVSNLSLCLKSNIPSNRIPLQNSCLSLLRYLDQTDFEDFLKSLSVIRLSDVLFDWNRINFSHRLVELEIQNLNLGYDSTLIRFLISLSSANEFISLKIIAVVTFPSLPTSQNTTKPTIFLPDGPTFGVRNLFYLYNHSSSPPPP
ncbi:hypothetical protein RSAG8_05951, partial [Rhizoctonia solani AG-8 WAC10335]